MSRNSLFIVAGWGYDTNMMSEKNSNVMLIRYSNNTMMKVSNYTLPDHRFGLPSFIKRIPYTNVHLIGGLKSAYICVLDEAKESLYMFYSFPNLHSSTIADMIFCNNTMFSVCSQDKTISIVKLYAQIHPDIGMSLLS